ncbi:MAG: endonuclease/exonuclease/phosphatase family protein [Pirellulales bacterium]
MQRILILAVLAGVGYMFLNGLHLEDIDHIFARSGSPPAAPAPGFPGGAGPALQPPVFVGQPQPPQAGQPTIRIASFNIQDWGNSKAQKPYVQDTLAKIIAQFDVVAVQEISTQDDYFLTNFLRDYGNQRQYAFVIGQRLGRSNNTEQYAYIYNLATVEVNPQAVFTMQDPQDLLHREPHVAMFRTRGAPPQQAFTFMLVNIHTDPELARKEMDVLADVYDAIRRMPIGEDDVIVLGDFNTDVPSSDPYLQPRTGRDLEPKDLGRLGQIAGIYPVIRSEATNTRGSKLHDNVLIHRGATTEFTGRSGVVDMQRMFNLSIDQALMVSDHRPVWAEFSVYESAAPGRMARGTAGATR